LGEIRKQKLEVEQESSDLRLLHMKAMQSAEQEHSGALDKLRREKTHENQEDNTCMQQQHQSEIQRLRQQLEEDKVRESHSQQQKFTTILRWKNSVKPKS